MTPRPRPEPRLELLEVCWHFVGPSQRVLKCGIYRVATGVEVRVGYSSDDVLRTQLTAELDAARALAAAWRQALIDKGGFSEVE